MKSIFYVLCEFLYKEPYFVFEYERFRIQTHIKRDLYYSDLDQIEIRSCFRALDCLNHI
jgi:hypothetical protein